ELPSQHAPLGIELFHSHLEALTAGAPPGCDHPREGHEEADLDGLCRSPDCTCTPECAAQPHGSRRPKTPEQCPAQKIACHGPFLLLTSACGLLGDLLMRDRFRLALPHVNLGAPRLSHRVPRPRACLRQIVS